MDENGWIGNGLGVREHPQCLVVNLEGCSYIQQKTLTFNKTLFGKKLDYFRVCWRQTAPPKMTAMTLGSYHGFGEK